MIKSLKIGVLTFAMAFMIFGTSVEAAELTDRINEAFRHVFSRNPSATENKYWLGRVVDGDKTTFYGLVNTMAYYRSLGKTMPTATVPLTERVNEAFRSVYGRNPLFLENKYWLIRVLNGDKTSYDALVGAMLFARATGDTVGGDPTLSDDKPESLKAIVRPLFFSIYGSVPTTPEKSWWQRRIDCEELLTHSGLKTSMIYHFTYNARIGSPNICRYALTPIPDAPDSDVDEDEGTHPVDTY